MLSKWILTFLILFAPSLWADETITIGSKRFTENYILAEAMSLLLEDRGFKVERRFGFGGTMIAYQALKNNEIQVYPEYTGTLYEAIFKTISPQQIESQLKKDGLSLLEPIGFSNNYCVVVTSKDAKKYGLKKMSDLEKHPDWLGAFSAEFQAREDGWPSLKKVYNYKNSIRNIENPLLYEALKSGEVRFVEAYTTEPLITKNNFIILKDDKNFFPNYAAVPLINKKLSLEAQKVLKLFHNLIDNETMTALNARATKGTTFQRVAYEFLLKRNLIQEKKTLQYDQYFDWSLLFKRTKDHLVLTLLAVLLATLIAVPLASFISTNRNLAQPVLAFTGVLQTIPSIALLTLMIPLVGIGFKPALLGLFIYSLLPILRNTYTAMRNIDPRLITAARGIGLYPWEIFVSIKLPLSFPTILAGIRTATILNIGTATLAAFIGAGGLGEPIVTGLSLNDTGIILQGAIPAALLAVIVDFLFGLVNRYFIRTL